MARWLTRGEASVFRSSSFSQRSFSVASWRFDGQIEKPAENGWLGGGFGLRDHFQSAAERQAERERLGIVPAEVKRAVEVVARIEARKPIDDFEASTAHAVEALRSELAADEFAWRDFYADLLREALQQLIDEELRWRLKAIMDEQDEEQAILLMLSEM